MGILLHCMVGNLFRLECKLRRCKLERWMREKRILSYLKIPYYESE